MDLNEAERMHAGAMPVRLLWSHDELDEALARDGWVRAAAWGYGPKAEVTRML